MKSIKVLIVFLVIISACKTPKYPNLEDGLYADIQTNIGDVVVKLHYKKAPMTVANFVALAEGDHPKMIDFFEEKPFYDGIKFHRVIDSFMIESGKVNVPQKEKVPYYFSNELQEDLKHDAPGIVSMVNLRKPYTNSTQFFITHKPAPWLDGYTKEGKKKPCGKYGTACHSVFGKVILGQTIVNRIKLNDSIRKVEIIRVGDGAANFNAPKVFSEISEKTIPFEIKMGIDSTYTTDSGLKILQLKKGSGKKVNPAWITKAHYTLYTTEGEKIASSIDKGKPITFTLNEDPLIAGWKEGARKMKEGEKCRLFIPSYLGYGSIGREPLIAPNKDLIFEIEILKVGK